MIDSSKLTRDYINMPLKRGELPSVDDIKYLFIDCNLSREETACICNCNIEKVKIVCRKFKIQKTKEQKNELRKKTNLLKYGVENISQLDSVKLKKEQSCLKHHNVKNGAQSEQGKANSKKTCLDKYGTEYYFQSQDFKYKKIQNSLNKSKGTINRRNLKIIIDESKIKHEFEIIKNGKADGYVTSYSWNELVLYFQWKEFYKKEIELWEENKLKQGLPLQSWIYLNRKKYLGKDATTLTDREILRAFKITGIYIGKSFHSPFYIQQFIKDYNIKSIYDCCGGWGHRLLGAYNIKYIYNDINSITNMNCKKMCDYFKLKDKYFYNEDSAYLTPKEDYEAVFTCPPYFNVEHYSDKGAENLSYSNFLIWWKQTIKAACLDKSSCKYFAFIINHQFKKDMVACCLDMGLSEIADIPLGKESYSHLNANKRGRGLKKEYLIVFEKV